MDNDRKPTLAKVEFTTFADLEAQLFWNEFTDNRTQTLLKIAIGYGLAKIEDNKPINLSKFLSGSDITHLRVTREDTEVLVVGVNFLSDQGEVTGKRIVIIGPTYGDGDWHTVEIYTHEGELGWVEKESQHECNLEEVILLALSQ